MLILQQNLHLSPLTGTELKIHLSIIYKTNTLMPKLKSTPKVCWLLRSSWKHEFKWSHNSSSSNCGGRDKYWSDLRNIEHYLSSSEIKVWKKSEYLHKVSDVHCDNYLTQCLIYVDLLFMNVNCLRGTSHWVFRSSRRETSCMQVTRCTILHFGNLAGVVL